MLIFKIEIGVSVPFKRVGFIPTIVILLGYRKVQYNKYIFKRNFIFFFYFVNNTNK